MFAKDYGFLSFAENMIKSIGINISKSLSLNYGHANQSATDALKTSSKKVIQKTSEATGDLIENKIANRGTKFSKNPQQKNLEAVTKEHDKEISTERYVSLEERQESIDELRLK